MSLEELIGVAGLREVGDNLNKHPGTTMSSAAELLDDLRESFLAGGGTDADWRDLVSRPNLPDWTVNWNSCADNGFSDKLTEMARYYMKPRTLVEVEVKDADEQQVRGVAILQLKEMKNPKSQWAAKLQVKRPLLQTGPRFILMISRTLKSTSARRLAALSSQPQKVVAISMWGGFDFSQCRKP